MIFTTAFFFMYLAGKLASIVADTKPPFASNGVGVTWKLSAESGPSFEHDVIANEESTDNVRIRFLFIIDKVFRRCAASGLEPAQPLLAKGF